MSLNVLSTSALKYLSESGHPERTDALRDLIERRAFHQDYNAETRRILTEYLAENPRGFCRDGIQKFRVAVLGEQPPSKKVQVILEFEVENPSHRLGASRSQDDGLVYDLVHLHLEGMEVGHSKKVLRNVRYLDYTATPADDSPRLPK